MNQQESIRLNEVQEILNCGSDYYKVLKLDKGYTEDDLKKSYKKLALKFHPDKNTTPGASDAFDLISKAFNILSDPQKKVVYDIGRKPVQENGWPLFIKLLPVVLITGYTVISKVFKDNNHS